MTFGGDKINAYQDVCSSTIGITDKNHLNSTISDAHCGARYCTGLSKRFYLDYTMQIYQYMRLHCRYITNEITDEYNITDNYFDSNSYVYLEIRNGMYGLKESAIPAYEQLRANLSQFGYITMKHTPGLWRHKSRPKTFTVAVDNFGIK